MTKDGRRVIPRDACLWCGHRPHRETCPSSIQVAVVAKRPVMEPCPCARRTAPTSGDGGHHQARRSVEASGPPSA